MRRRSAGESPEGIYWVAVKEFGLSYQNPETLSFTMYLHLLKFSS